jgi:hypothetical protein
VTRHEVKVRNHVFFIRRFDPFTATEILGDLQRDFAGPLLAGLGSNKPGEAGGGTQALMGGLAELSSKMDGKKLRSWAERLLDPEVVSVSIDGGEAQKLTKVALAQSIDSSSELISLCFESVKFNFEDFRERWSGLISSALSRMAASQPGNSALN